MSAANIENMAINRLIASNKWQMIGTVVESKPSAMNVVLDNSSEPKGISATAMPVIYFSASRRMTLPSHQEKVSSSYDRRSIERILESKPFSLNVTKDKSRKSRAIGATTMHVTNLSTARLITRSSHPNKGSTNDRQTIAIILKSEPSALHIASDRSSEFNALIANPLLCASCHTTILMNRQSWGYSLNAANAISSNCPLRLTPSSSLLPFEQHMERQTRITHEKIAAIWPEDIVRTPICSLTSSILANQYYLMHVPRKTNVKVLVLAESHARTFEGAVGLPSVVSGCHEPFHIGHVNLVHCPSYGEPWLIGHDKSSPLMQEQSSIQTGTTNFWQVLATLAGDLDDKDLSTEEAAHRTLKTAFQRVRKGDNKDPQKRMEAKIAILNRMKARGIVFADICPIAVYLTIPIIKKRNQKTGHEYTTPEFKIPDRLFKQILQIAWDNYAAHLIDALRPHRLVLLGKKGYQSVGKERLEQVTNSFGTTIHPPLLHPSCKTQKKHLLWKAIRDSCRDVAEAGTVA